MFVGQKVVRLMTLNLRNASWDFVEVWTGLYEAAHINSNGVFFKPKKNQITIKQQDSHLGSVTDKVPWMHPHPDRQWAAVNTHRLEIRDPPQKCAPSVSRETCQGHTPGDEFSPPTILVFRGAIPHSRRDVFLDFHHYPNSVIDLCAHGHLPLTPTVTTTGSQTTHSLHLDSRTKLN